MHRFKSRSSKVQPYGASVVDSLLFTKVMPDIDVFSKTNDCCQAYSEPKRTSNKTSYKSLSRMDDPEEVFESSAVPTGRSGHSLSLPKYDKVLYVNPGKFPCPGSCEDFSSRFDTFQISDRVVNVLPRRKEIFGKCNVGNQLENTVDCDIRKKSAGNSNSIVKPLQRMESLSHNEVLRKKGSDQTKRMEFLEWITNTEKCYRYILHVKQSFANSSTWTRKEAPEFDHPLVGDDLEHFQGVSGFSPEALVFSAVVNNLDNKLENIIRNYNIDLNICCNSKNLTPLHLAAKLGFSQCVQVLLKHGSDVNHLNSENRSPLYMAFTGQHYECVILLIEAGADIHQYTAQKLNEFEIAKRISQTYKRALVCTNV